MICNIALNRKLQPAYDLETSHGPILWSCERIRCLEKHKLVCEDDTKTYIFEKAMDLKTLKEVAPLKPLIIS